MTNISPRGRMILVKSDSEESRVSELGIVTPSAVELERKAVGTVVAVSPMFENVTPPYDIGIPKVGDKIIYGIFAGEQIKTRENSKEVEYRLLYCSDDHDNEILAFIR